MSEYIARRRVNEILRHPNADKLLILKIGQFQVIHSKEEAERLKVGDMVIHIPTDICIDPVLADNLGISPYLRHCQYKEFGKVPCRVIAARIRGVPSYGFFTLHDIPAPEEAYDVYFGVEKYEPPEPKSHEIEAYENVHFPRYTRIRRMQLNPEPWTDGTEVVVTEKLHGRNMRFGVVPDKNGDWRFMVGTHNTISREYNKKGERSATWEMLSEGIMSMLNEICDEQNTVVVYGEKIGLGVQDMDYGYIKPEIRVFDIMVNGRYLDFDLVRMYCRLNNVMHVPVIYEGSFSWNMVDAFTDGGSVVQNPSLYKTQFKGREGIVVRPRKETFSCVHGRLIGKSISVDYESRKGNKTEYH